MRTSAAAVLLAALAVASPGAAGVASDATEAHARAIVARMHEKLNGASAPYAVASISFTFEVEREGAAVTHREHRWHPQTGQHHVSYAAKDGAAMVVDWNLGTGTGSATRSQAPLAGEELTGAIEAARKAWVNDFYWLLMPYKLADPGVHLAYDGETTRDGRIFDTVRVTFDRVGLTPGDTYWATIARDTGLMERWAFVLEGQSPPPVEFAWSGFESHGPLVLATRKTRADGTLVVRTGSIVVH